MEPQITQFMKIFSLLISEMIFLKLQITILHTLVFEKKCKHLKLPYELWITVIHSVFLIIHVFLMQCEINLKECERTNEKHTMFLITQECVMVDF